MLLRILRHTGWLALLAASAVATGCSNNPAPVPDAFVAALVGPGNNGTACHFGTPQQWLDIGTPVAGKPTTVQDGNAQAGSTVHVSCSISTSGNGFDVNLNATQEGLMGGSVTITSPPGTGAVTQSGATGITAAFESGTNGTYRDSNCSISFTYNGDAVPDQPPLAGGRIWGHLSCPNAVNPTQTVPDADGGGGTQSVTCDGEADFLFEQCGQ